MKAMSRLGEWSRLFSEYAVAQAAIQVLGLLAGLWLVNLLPVREYALYTFALSIFTFLSVFSDLGVSNALLYFKRETAASGTAFEPYVAAAYGIRYGLVGVGAIAGLAFMAATGLERGFTLPDLARTGVVLLAAVWVQVGASILTLQLRIAGKYRESYLAEVYGNAVRLAAVAAIWFASAPLAWLAMLTAVAGAWVTRQAARRFGGHSGERPDRPAGASPGREPMRGIVRYVLPMSLSAAYFSIQAPLTVWLSAYFAGTQSVAEVGALGRLGLIFGLISSFVSTVLVPRMAVVTDNAHYLKRHLQFCGLLAAFGIAVIACAAAVPGWFLLLLGSSYSGLGEGVLLIAVSAVLSAWGGYLVAINGARGWVRLQPPLLAIFALVQVLLVSVLDLSSTSGVLYYGLWSNLAGLVLQGAVNMAGFLDVRWVAVRK